MKLLLLLFINIISIQSSTLRNSNNYYLKLSDDTDLFVSLFKNGGDIEIKETMKYILIYLFQILIHYMVQIQIIFQQLKFIVMLMDVIYFHI